jgi:hypothetical protein
MADKNKWKIVVTDSEEGSEGFILVSWDQQADGNFKVAVNQGDPGNLLEVERVLRVLSRMLAQSESPLYNLIGESCLSTMDFALEKYAELASPLPEA